MTRFRKLLVGLAIAAAATVPVGIAYAADSGGGGHHTPVSGMMRGDMDPADCPHAAQHEVHMSGQGMMNGQGMTCAAGSSTRAGS
jgi:hypothetical protein